MTPRLFEAHIPVRDLQRSLKFYQRVLGLELGRFETERRVAFLFIGGWAESMLGLWERPEAEIGCHHFAIEVKADEIPVLIDGLRQQGIEPYNFLEDGSDQPMVFAWMPALSIYFKDPDGHELEYIARLSGDPQPDGGIVSLQQWQATGGRRQ